MSMRELPADTCVCRMGQLYINEVVLGTAIGVLFGPYCANIFNPRSWGGDTNVITLEVMRVTLAAGLFAIGVELPQSYLWEHVRGLLVMVVPTMAFGWLVVAGMLLSLPRTAQCEAYPPFIQESSSSSFRRSTSSRRLSSRLVLRPQILSSLLQSLVCTSTARGAYMRLTMPQAASSRRNTSHSTCAASYQQSPLRTMAWHIRS